MSPAFFSMGISTKIFALSFGKRLKKPSEKYAGKILSPLALRALSFTDEAVNGLLFLKGYF